IVEYVLGSALEQLRYSPEQYWKDLRVAIPPSPGLPRFDQRVDVAQIGITALSLILGRLVAEDEYPAGIQDVVSSAWAISAHGEPRSAQALRVRPRSARGTRQGPRVRGRLHRRELRRQGCRSESHAQESDGAFDATARSRDASGVHDEIRS